MAVNKKNIIIFIINIWIPGLGTVIWGDYIKGVAQLVLLIIGIPLSLTPYGIPFLLGAVIWALVTGIKKLKESTPN